MEKIKKSQTIKEIKLQKASVKKNDIIKKKTIIKEKTPKIKKNNTIKKDTLKTTPKIKKSKSKNAKVKIITKVVAIALIVGLFVWTFGIFVRNDFAMTVVFSNNTNRSFYIIESEMEDVFNSRYFEMELYTVVREAGSETPITGEVSAKIKAIHYDDDTYGYIAEVHSELYDAILYYKDQQLYTNYISVNYKQKTSINTAQDSLRLTIMPNLDGKYVLPTSSGVLADKSTFQSMQTSFIINTSPFYIGECFNTQYSDEKEIYKIDMDGNLKERTYIEIQQSDEMTAELLVTVKYISINKNFVLEYPTDLDTY